MSVTVQQLHRYIDLMKTICADPRRGNFLALARLIKEVRERGEPCDSLLVPLEGSTPQAKKLAAIYTLAQIQYPKLPPLAWKGGPPNVSGARVEGHRLAFE